MSHSKKATRVDGSKEYIFNKVSVRTEQSDLIF
jgi:hypothetical protein